MKKQIKFAFWNFMISLFALVSACFIAELIYTKFANQHEIRIHEEWTCGNGTKSLIGGFKPNCKGKWIKTNGADSFDTVFTTDEFGRRTVFKKKNKSTSDSGQILFFGGSDVLGKGVNDQDTVANQFFNLSDFAKVRNYGGAGFGPQHALELLQFSDLTQEAPPDPKRNVIVFFYADHHIERAYGSWPVATTWGAKFPYYDLSSDDQLVFKGNFTSGNRYSSLQLLAKESHLFNDIITYASNHSSYSDAEIRLTAKIFAAINAKFSSQYVNAHFYVIFNPITTKTSAKLKGYLNEFGVAFLDYSKVWNPENLTNWIPEGHPSALVYHAVAQQLALDLKK